MQQRFNPLTFFCLLLSGFLLLSSCKKEAVSPDPEPEPDPVKSEYPAAIANFLTTGMIDSLKSAGAKIYSGKTPPTVNGIFFMHPDSCTYDNSPAALANTIFSDYRFRFSNQNNSAFSITVEQKAMPSGQLSSIPVASYISGSGNNFTVFIPRTLTPSGIAVQQYNILSGTVVAGGIQELQNTLYMRSKGNDPDHLVTEAGTIRVFVTGKPGLAATTSEF